MSDLVCEYCGKQCSSKSGLTLHMKRCSKKPCKETTPVEAVEEPAPEQEPEVQTPPSTKHAKLNAKLIEAIKDRTFTRKELEALHFVVKEKLSEYEGEVFQLDNGGAIRLKDKIQLARRYLMVCRKVHEPEVLQTCDCPKCEQPTNIKIGSEPRGEGKSVVHFYCQNCDTWSEKEL